jgi:hypothetical protein
MFRERRNMNHRLAGIVVALVVIFALLASAQNAPNASAPTSARTATDKSAKSRGGPDANIKEDKNQVATNDPAQEPAAPPQKGGQKQRGPNDCWLTADNYTPWYINVYVDGTYRGQLSPWGKGIVNAGAGTTLYGRADFPNGSYNSWGPRVFTCSPTGTFIWRLHQ